MEPVPLLQTKLYVPPVRPGLVSRPRLMERLDAALPTLEGFPRALTLISAPAGFGKTTLVSEWLHGRDALAVPLQVAWLSLDEGDNDPARFLAYMIAALQSPALSGAEGLEANLSDGVLNALLSPQPPPTEAVLTSLINEIAALPDRIVFILDDYHQIEAQPIHDALSFLLEHLPPQMHLVMATREDPPLPLARLRALGQLTELRAADLRFSSSEAAEFLNQVKNLDLLAEDIASLETRTEGWIAGLQLAALALQGTLSLRRREDTASLIQAFSGSHRFVLDYLIEEVLEQQSDSVQEFMLQTSILDRLTGALCDAVRLGETEAPSTAGADAVRFGFQPTAVNVGSAAARAGQRNGQAILEMLEQANLFILPLDEERRWYRYHTLFCDLLRLRLRQTQPDQLPILHNRASAWYERNGFINEAIEHALRAEDFERAAGLLEEHADAMWTRGEHAKLRRWLAQLPGEVVFRRPLLCVFHAWFLYAKGPQDAAEQYLQAAEQVLDSSDESVADTMLPEQGQLSDTDRQKLGGRAAVIRAFMASFLGDVPAIIEHAGQALEYLPKQDLIWRSTAALALGDAQGFRGNMVAAYQARQEAAEASRAAGNTIFSILAYLKVALTLREQGRLQQTIELCQQQIQFAGKSGLSQGSVTGCLLAIWGEVLAELDDLEEALAQARRGVELAEHGGDWSLFGWSCLCLMRVMVSRGSLSEAAELVEKLEHTASESDVPPWITNQMAAWQARLWLAQGKLEAACQWANARGLVTTKEPRPLQELDFFTLIEYIVLVRILVAQEQLDEATRLLPQLLEAAEAGDRTTRVIEILNLLALTFQAEGNTAQAMITLERALTLAEPGGFIRTFVDEGLTMSRLLEQLRGKGVAVDYINRILLAFGTTRQGSGNAGRQTTAVSLGPPPVVDGPSSEVHRPPPTLVEPLSEREVEVLQLIAEGLTNREIASRLFLSLNTVKAHTRSIYGKLGVRSRTQAVARARALGVLPSS